MNLFSTRSISLAISLVTLSLVSVACQSQVGPTPSLSAQSSSTVVTSRVAASTDDAEEGASGRVYRASTDLELVYDGSAQTVGLRFVKVAVPRGATITGAYVQFKTDERTSVSTALTIRGQAADSAPTFSSTSKNVSSRPRTAASVAWSPPAWKKVGEAGPGQRTPNLAPVVQEVVNRSGWASGNALAFIVTGKGKRVAESFDGTRTGAPLLRVTYTVPATNQPPTVNAGADQVVAPSEAASLSGDVADDGEPNGTLSALWSQVSGPGTVTFADSRSAQTTASFSAMGDYVLRLTASDGALTSSDNVAVTVQDAPEGSVTVVAAGDIACSPASSYFNGGLGTADKCRQKYTADLIGQLGANAVFALGDNQYEEGTLNQFMKSYDLSWGRYKAITYPVPGNHEYRVPGAADYYSYFGARAGDPAKGYYSFDLGDWHVVALNSNCEAVSCAAGSEQETWLRADLAAHPKECTLAYWHHPLFSSGSHGNDPATKDFWRALSEAGAELVLVGHDHNYERFAPQTAEGVADAEAGIRQFVVGTGGKNHYSISTAQPNSEVINGNTHGVLKLDLYAGGYNWAFVPEAGATFTDTGSATCH